MTLENTLGVYSLFILNVRAITGNDATIDG